MAKEKRIKLVVTDVDGTLLDENSVLPELNKKALIDCKENGIEIILATGKTVYSIMNLIELLNLKLPQITLSGAVIANKNLEIIRSIIIGTKNYLHVVKDIKKKGYYPLVSNINGKIYFEQYHPNMSELINVGENIIKVDNLETNYFVQNAADITVTISEKDPLDKCLREKYSSKLQFVRSGKFFFDILNLNATKGGALSYILKKNKIKREEVVVIGDSYNDISMFNIVGLTIAVKNSYEDVLRKANFTTDENYKCGVANAIYKYIIR